MATEPFKRLIPDKSRVSAKDTNLTFTILEGLMSSGFADGILTSDGKIILRKRPCITPGTKIYPAVTTQAAGGTNVILVNLYDSIGIVISTGTEGVDYNIPIYCKTSPPLEPLNTCSRRLASGDSIAVHREIYDDEGTPTERWTSDEGFMASLDHESL